MVAASAFSRPCRRDVGVRLLVQQEVDQAQSLGRPAVSQQPAQPWQPARGVTHATPS
jgi:hypothetical protein